MTARKYMRNFKPIHTEQEQPTLEEQLRWRVHEDCAIYARQSTTKQTVENRESSEMQTKDQLEKVYVLGWKGGKITVFIEGDGKRGVSGTLRIDERPGLSALMEGVYNDKYKTIFVMNEARLFREEWMIGTDTFIKACYEHNVQVVTWTHRYDFKRNPYDADQFRMQCQIAARFIKDHVKGVLHPARDRVARRGQYAGGQLPIGYILDRRKYIDGAVNPSYNRFIIDEPRAEMIRWIYKRYRALGGNLSELGRELNAMPFVFPPYDASVRGPRPSLPPARNGGHGLGRTGLISILTNTAYIGYFKHRDVIRRGQDGHPVLNHPPIIEEDEFWYAFNSLSPITIDGEINEQRTHKLVRYNQKGKPTSKALLKEIITSPGASVSIARMSETNESYTIVKPARDFEYRSQARTEVSLLDAEFVKRMFHHIHEWKKLEEAEDNSIGSTIYERLQEEKATKQQQATSSIEGQLEETRRQIARLDRLLNVASDDFDDDTIKIYARRLKALRLLEKELTTKQEEVEKEAAAAVESETLLDRVLTDWNSFALEQKRRAIRLMVDSVVIVRQSPRWLQVEVTWKSPILPTTDTGYLWLTNATNPDWQPEEVEILRKMYPHEDADAILEKLPNRTWTGIIAYAERIQISRSVRKGPAKHPFYRLSIEDYQFMVRHGIEPREKRGEQRMLWIENDAFLLPTESVDDIIDDDIITTDINGDYDLLAKAFTTK